MEEITVDFQDFLFWLGLAITLGMAAVFGGLLGFGLFAWLRQVFIAGDTK
jgi:hypothetical protein